MSIFRLFDGLTRLILPLCDSHLEERGPLGTFELKEDLLLTMINQLKNTYRNQVKKDIYTSRIYLRKKVFGQMKNAVLMT